MVLEEHLAKLSSRSLVRAVEVWTPDADGGQLVWQSGAYGELMDLEEVSRHTTFVCGEGLPGVAWQHRAPIVMHGLGSGEFKRASEARAAGLSCGIGIPFFCDREFRGVAVFLCDEGEDLHGAFEVWSLNERQELGLQASYYANLEHFGQLSHFVKFPRGAGLPGQAWQMRFPRLLDSLATCSTFMRGAGAQADGLEVGIGLPLMRTAWDLEAVVVLLSSRRTPLARVFEVWLADADEGLEFHSGWYSSMTDLDQTSRPLRYAPGEGLAGRVLAAGQPMVSTDTPSIEPGRGELLEHHELYTALSMPIFVGSVTVAVVNLFI